MSADIYMILEVLGQQQQQQQQPPVGNGDRASVRDVGINTMPYCDTINDTVV